jgi:hypothetical protein
MTQGILSTLTIAALGLIAAKAGDLLRIPLFRGTPCEDTHSKGAAWSYDANTAQQKGGWLRVQRNGTC